MKKLIIIVTVLVVVVFSWYFGQSKKILRSYFGASADTAILSDNSAKQKKVINDHIAPVSTLSKTMLLGFGKSVTGKASDLGSGLGQVNIQIQRVSDGAVWDGLSWQESPGSVIEANIDGNKFGWRVNTVLAKGEIYIVRSQAIDRAGNAQTNWSEMQVFGNDLGQAMLN